MNLLKRTVKDVVVFMGINPSSLSQLIYGFDRTFEENNLLADYFKETGDTNILVDVGVAFGHVSKQFLDKGWTVFGFEPDNDPEKNLLIGKIRNERFSLDRRAVSNESGKKLKFYTSDISAGISSLHAFHDEHEYSHEVTTVSLTDFIDEKSIQKIDFLKIDTEGNDLFVLEGFPFSQCKPRVIVAEFDEQKTDTVGYSYKKIGDLLNANGYVAYLSEWYPIQEYGTRHKFRHIVRYPQELSDSKAWGNFIAVREDEVDAFEVFISNNPVGKYYKKA